MRELDEILPPGWELETLGLTNPRKPSNLDLWFQFLLADLPFLEGDVLEIGVYRGSSLLPTAMLAKEADRKVFGFDSFMGFPKEVDTRDEPGYFEELYRAGHISEEHFFATEKRQRLFNDFESEAEVRDSVSSSGNFSATSRGRVERLIEVFEVDNVELIDGFFDESILSFPDQVLIAGINLDCDLFEGYDLALKKFTSQLVSGGMVNLDEYYSLKFPGPRLAVDRYLDENPGTYDLKKVVDPSNGFERCVLKKL